MNDVFFNSLCVEPAILKKLEEIPHRWEKLNGGAVVFFVSSEGRGVYLAYPVRSIVKHEIRAAFYGSAARHPLVRRIDRSFFANDPLMGEELAKWGLEEPKKHTW